MISNIRKGLFMKCNKYWIRLLAELENEFQNDKTIDIHSMAIPHLSSFLSKFSKYIKIFTKIILGIKKKKWNMIEFGSIKCTSLRKENENLATRHNTHTKTIEILTKKIY